MINRIKEFNEEHTTIYVLISIIILVIILSFMSISNKKNNNIIKETKKCNSVVIDDSKKILYEVKVKRDNEIVIFNIKRYNNKYLIEKTENGYLTYYYMYFNDIYMSNDNINFSLYDKTDVSDGINIKLLLLDYISDITSYANDIEPVDNCYVNNDNTIKSCVISDDMISVEIDNLLISYEVKNIGKVEDFNVNIIIDDSV